MITIDSKKCLRCGKTLKDSSSSHSGDVYSDRDRIIKQAMTKPMNCAIEGQIRALKSWKENGIVEKEKKYCFKCSLITKMKRIFSR